MTRQLHVGGHVRFAVDQRPCRPGVRPHPYPGQARPHLGQARPHLGQAHPHLGQTRPHLGQAPPHLGHARPHLEQARPHLGKARLHLGQTRPHLGQAPPHLGQAPPHLGQAPPHLGQARPHLGHARPHLGQARPHLGQARPHLGQACPHLEQARPHLEQAPPHIGQAPPHLGPARLHLGQARPHIGQARPHLRQVHLHAGQPHPYPGQPHPHQGQPHRQARPHLGQAHTHRRQAHPHLGQVHLYQWTSAPTPTPSQDRRQACLRHYLRPARPHQYPTWQRPYPRQTHSEHVPACCTGPAHTHQYPTGQQPYPRQAHAEHVPVHYTGPALTHEYPRQAGQPEPEAEAGQAVEFLVQKFFEKHPEAENVAWNGYVGRSRHLCSGSNHPGFSCPTCPIELRVQDSDVRGDEALDRVADVVFSVVNAQENPIHMFRNKAFSAFYDRENGVFSIPKNDVELKSGDFDIIIVHKKYGYINIEVKATGCSPTNITEGEAIKSLINVLEDRAVKTLTKGRKALEYMQPGKEKINIISSLALPNTQREILRKALKENPCLHKALQNLLDHRGELDTEVVDLCLCSEDLPPKDSTTVEHTDTVKQSVMAWWSRITRANCPERPPMSREAFRMALAGFFRDDKIQTEAEHVNEAGKQFEELVLNDKQSSIIALENKHVFITGPPGCGKSIVLAEKARQWLKKGEAVFLVYKDGPCTSQPGTECLKQYIKKLSKNDCTEKLFSKLRTIALPSHVDVQDFIADIVREYCKMENVTTGVANRKPCQFKRHQDDSVKIVPFDQLQSFFPRLDLETMRSGCQNTDGRNLSLSTTWQDLPPIQRQGLNIIIDEIIWRTINGKRVELISALTAQLREAGLWGAGPFPTDCPAEFRVEKLTHPYRCPPSVQCLLRSLEFFCHGGKDNIHRYCLRRTCVTEDPPCSDRQYVLPCHGVKPMFLSHAGHKTDDVINCTICVENLLHVLKERLSIHKSSVPGSGDRFLTEKDVMIVLTGIETCNNMSHVAFSELFRQLTSPTPPNDDPQYDVKIYENSMRDTYDPQTSKMTICHVRAVGGLEKKVVVFVPCCKYKMPATAAAPNEENLPIPEANPEDPLERLMRCKDLCLESRQALANMGKLNLHWLWYAASRTLSQLISFHF